MAQFKKMKMRINNPDHSKAVQEWLFEQGYGWQAYSKVPALVDYCYLFTGSRSEGHITASSSDADFVHNSGEEINVQHLDPNLYSVHKSSCTPSRAYREKPKVKSEFEKLTQQLKHLDKAIQAHENKQNKRKLDRQRIIEKIEGMLPGYRLVREEPVATGVVEVEPEFDPEEIVEGSVWECVGEMGEGSLLYKRIPL